MFGTLLKVIYDSRAAGRHGSRAPLGAYVRNVVKQAETKKIAVWTLPSLFTVKGAGPGAIRSIKQIEADIGEDPQAGFLTAIKGFKNRKMEDIYDMIERWLGESAGWNTKGSNSPVGKIQLPITVYQFDNAPTTIPQCYGALRFSMKALSFELMCAKRFIESINTAIINSSYWDGLFNELEVDHILTVMKAMQDWEDGVRLVKGTWQGAQVVQVHLDANKMDITKTVSQADWIRWKNWLVSYTA